MHEELETAVPENTDAQTSEQPVEIPAAEPLAEQTVEALADGFLQLQQEVPALQGIEEVPEAVLQTAAKENISLFDAYLRYRWYEQQAILAEEARQQRTAALSAGSLQTGGLRVAPVSDAFARAFEQALR